MSILRLCSWGSILAGIFRGSFILGGCLCLVFSSRVYAQQPHVYSQFFVNPYVYNSALAGLEGHTAVFLVYRSQWQGINDAPEISHVNWHVPLRRSFALGSQFSNQRLGPLTDNSFKVTTAYLLSIDRTHFFRFGLSLGGGARSVSFPDLIDASGLYSSRNTGYLQGYLENSSYFLADAGLMYHFGRFNIGASFPDLIARAVIHTGTLSPVVSRPLDNIFFTMDYRLPLFNDNVALEPHGVYRFSALGTNQWEMVMIFHILHTVWLGASYRQDAGGNLLTGFKMLESFALGYSYEIPFFSDLSPYTTGSHEVHIGIHIGAKKRHAAHSSSFIKSHSKSLEERLAEKAIKEGEEAQASEGELLDLLDMEAEDITPPLEAPVVVPPAVVPPVPAAAAAAPLPSAVQLEEDQTLKLRDSDETWRPQVEEEPYVRSGDEGLEEAVTLFREGDPTEKTYALGWVPLPRGGAQKTWSLQEDVPLEKRKNSEGRDELVAVWTLKDSGGLRTNRSVVFPIYSADELERIIQEEGAIRRKTIPIYLSNKETSRAYKDDYIKLGTVVRKGNHIMELPIGSYVIAGSFRSYENAERFSISLGRKGYVSSVGYNSERELFYVDVFSSLDLTRVRAERDSLRKKALFKNVWVLTVIPR
ncbi:MAG: PorP/SprF family type IX secretion system membrane protein [Cytophagales bacterium]|nr:PorP/SprF family type IX secretion system membrane protein [Cytophagales bacterium]